MEESPLLEKTIFFKKCESLSSLFIAGSSGVGRKTERR